MPFVHTVRGTALAATLALLSTATLTAAVTAVPAHAEPVTETRLGVPHRTLAIYGATFGSTPDGDYAYAVARGTTGALSVIDTRTATVVRTLELPGGGGSWGGTVTADGTAYVGVDGKLFRYRPGAQNVEDLGTPVPGETTAWRLTTDGERVFVGTFPNGKVYSFDHRTDQVRDYGQVWPDEQYARSIGISGGKIYVGLGTVARVVEIDIDSGARREIPLPEKYRAEQFVYDLDVHRRTMFVRLANSNQVLVYDLKTGAWTGELGTGRGLDFSPPDAKGNVYFSSGAGQLMAYNLDSSQVTPTGFTGFGTSRGFGWAHLDGPEWPGRTLVTIDLGGKLSYYNPVTGKSKTARPGVPGRPVQLQTVAAGPDGRIWSSGYPSGGITAFDPATGTFAENQGALGQAEGLYAHQGKVYAGVYPGANLFELDPAKPVVAGSNPRKLGSVGEEQDRPFAITGVGDRVAFGTIPAYGQLGGALTLIDPATGVKEVHRNVVPDQSVTALTTVGGLVLGGTGVWGGLGSTPTATEAKLFLWDPATSTKVWEGSALPGAKAITQLVVAPDGKVWGATSGTLFEFDPASRTVLRSVEIEPFNWQGVTHVWRSDHLAFAPDGDLCGNFRNTIACVDPATLSVQKLATGINDIWTMDAGGDMYYARGAELYRLSR